MPNQKRVFIIHCWGDNPNKNWYPWLAKKLRERVYSVEVPQMPDTDNPKIEAWVGHLAKIVGKCDENTHFIGHSIGCQTIMRYLERLSDNEKTGGEVFVAPWITLSGIDDEEERFISSPWVITPIDYEKVKNQTKKIIAIFSDNDPYVSKENWEIFSQKLGTENIIDKNKGHFTEDDGIKELPVALDSIIKIIQ